jgi:tyramine---L-glutamate ligase
MLLQPFVAGTPASAAFLVGPGQVLALPPTRQRVSEDGRFRYEGGSLPLPPAEAGRAANLARRAVEAVPGLFGYVGVDLVLAGVADGDRVLEINPRLTTSYVGLRSLAEDNLAAALLRVAAGEDAAVRWRDGSVRFGADGGVCVG